MIKRSEGEGMERRQIAMLAALGAIVVLLVYFVFLRGGEAPNDPAGTTAAPPPAVAQAETSPDPFEPGTSSSGSQPVETYQVFASRDPFEPVIENGSDGAGVDAGEVMGDNPVAEPRAEPRANNDEVQGHAVTLVDVFRQQGKNKAQVEIDSAGYNVGEGEVFAENFQLVSTSGDCATLLYGDDQFTLCEGEEILK
jgi:hypothetical protein